MIFSLVTISKKKLSIFIEISKLSTRIFEDMELNGIDITSLLDRELAYAVITIKGVVVRLSETARKTFSCHEGNSIQKCLENTPLAAWSELIEGSLGKAKENGSHIEDVWLIDEKGHVRRYTHLYRYCREENVVIVIWFEIKDRLNYLLKTYDKKRSRFRIWNGAYLTVKELRTIAYYVQGLSYKAIANQEHISHAAVSARLQTIAQKAGFDSVPALHTALFEELYPDNRLPQIFNML